MVFPLLSHDRSGYRIFSRGEIAGLPLKNRLVRSATYENAASEGIMTPAGLEIFRSLASGGVGLIITGAIPVSAAGRLNNFGLMANDDGQIANLRLVVRTVRDVATDCKVIAQLVHGGPNLRTGPPVGASAKPWGASEPVPRALTTGEVEQIVSEFARAGLRTKEAGFDGIQLHAAHGYLLSSFLSPYSNQRTDKYGGSAERRVRIIREIVDETRKTVGPDFPILIKMNSEEQVEGGISPESFSGIARRVENAGIQALEISGDNPCRTDIAAPDRQSYYLKQAQSLSTNLPVILTGGNRSVERLEGICNRGGANFIGLARPLLREPDLPKRWLEGRGTEGVACISCNRCINALIAGLTGEDAGVTRCRLKPAA
jgi:2,4-dienoyl-CoA reductase-like NADH-dependent reductase (Old Yellow Enzyme family)